MPRRSWVLLCVSTFHAGSLPRMPSTLAYLSRICSSSCKFHLNYLLLLEALPGTSRQNCQIFLWCHNYTYNTFIDALTSEYCVIVCICLFPLWKPKVNRIIARILCTSSLFVYMSANSWRAGSGSHSCCIPSQHQTKAYKL